MTGRLVKEEGAVMGLTGMQFPGMGIYIAVAIAVMLPHKKPLADADLAKKQPAGYH